MATGGHCREITNRQYVELGRVISSTDMESIALGYLSIDEETIRNIRYEHRGNAEAFNRDILKRWANRNPVPDQVKELASILYKAAIEHGYVDPKKVNKVLGVSRRDIIEAEDMLEIEFMSLAEHLRPWTEKAMKIEVAPWIRDYIVDMNELYTNLTLEKAEYTLDGEKCQVLKSYKEVFEIPDPKQELFNFISEHIEIRTVQESKKKNEARRRKGFKSLLPCTGKYNSEFEEEIQKVQEGKKILFKGEPGMGKTTVGKKIGWDWAVGTLETFQIIFFVFLKFVQPEDSIENIIIKQTPVLKGLGITESKLLSFLQKFGNRCLLILDGFDECGQGQNQDVVEIVRKEKLFSCNILLTSRPHSTREITEYFQTVVKVSGFTEHEARKFAFKILKDGELVNDVLSFTPATLTDEDIKLFQCPILLSFLCLLVRENEISLSDKAISVGEIYTRMVRCLYRKFTIRKNRKFDETKFLETLKRLGKIAFRTLLSGNPLLKRSDIVKEVDEEVFDYGLLIGHEDAFRLIRDETADIFITFSHRSIQEFLGALYFVLMLSSNTTINTLFYESKPIVMTDPLFLDFCLWFLSKKNVYIPIDGKDAILTTLAKFCVVTLANKGWKYPALDLGRAERKNDELMFAFLYIIIDQFVGRFENANTIAWIFMDPSQKIHQAMMENYQKIRCIKIKGLFSYLVNDKNCTIKVLMKMKNDIPECLVHLIAKDSAMFHKPAIVQFFRKGNDFSVASVSPFSRLITHMFVISCSVSEAQMKLLAEIVTQEELPRLIHLSFISCKLATLSPFLKVEWLHLSHLNFSSCDLGKPNCISLAEALIFQFPNLTSLIVVDQHVEHFLDTIFKHDLVDLKQISLCFYLRNYTAGMTQLNAFASKRKMPNLSDLCLLGFEDLSPVVDMVKSLPLESLALSNFQTTNYDLAELYIAFSRLNLRELKLTDCPNVGGNLFPLLLSNSLTILDTLTLRKCNLGPSDLHILAEANVEQKLPKLKHLDISLNGGNLEDFFANSTPWNELVSLNILHTFQQCKKDVSPQCFRALEHLSVSGQTLSFLFDRRIFWQSLQSLHVFMLDEKSMSDIVRTQEQNLLPALESLCVELPNAERSVFDIDEAHKLRNVSIHDAESLRDDLCPWGCVCYDDRRIDE